MKVFLDGNFNIKSVTDDVGDVIVRGSNSFDKLYVYVPTSAISDYTTISPLYAVKRADGRELGKYATLTNHATDGDAVANYYGWYGFFNQRDICVAGPLEITISFLLVKNGISSEKSVCKVTVDIKDGVMVGDDVLILNNSNWTSLKASIEALVTNLANKADRTNSQQTITGDKFYGSYADIIEIVSNTVEALSAVITNLTVQENITAGNINATTINGTTIKQYNNAVLDVRDIVDSFISESTTKALSAKKGKELKYLVDTKVARADVVNNLTDTSINKPLSAKQGKILKDEIDYIYTLLDSDDTSLDELQEIVTYIKNNKSLIDGITTSKVSVSDIVDNLNSNDTNKPLSAKQGHILKGLINNLQTAINNTYTKSETDDLLDDKADKSTTYTKDDVDDKLALKQNITIPTITIAGVNYTNLEQAIGALNEYAKTIEQVIGSISGTDTSIVTKLTQLETNLSNLNTAWNTFISGTSADNIINTLTEIRDELTNLHNLITAETTRATTQENKSLYHLGAFDSADGKTRRSWVVDAKDLTWGYSTTYGNWYSLESLKGAVIPSSDDDIVANGFVSSNYSTYGTANQVRTHNANYGLNYNGQIMIYNGSSTEQPSGTFQYKLATPYTDTPIEGESILPLDSNMAQMIRQDVVDSLNIFDVYAQHNFTGVNGDTDQTIDYYIRPISEGTIYTTYNSAVTNRAGYIFDVSVGKKYTFSAITDNQCHISVEDGNGALFNSASLTGNISFNFIPTTQKVVIRFGHNGGNAPTISNIMLSVNPYPHSEYHASKHITDDEATLLKQEEEKCRNLLNLLNKSFTNYGVTVSTSSNGTITISGTANSSGSLFLPLKDLILNGTYTMKLNENTDINFSNIAIYFMQGYGEVFSFDGASPITIQTKIVNNTINTLQVYAVNGQTYNLTLKPMLNKGTEAKPYQEWYGGIVHEKDIEPVLLWENPNPNSAYSGDVLTIPTLPNYKYLVIQFKTGDYEYTMKLPRGSSNNEFRSFLQSAGYYNSNYTIGIRMVEQQPSTQTYLYIGSGANQTTVTSDNNMCVPTKIYGTNIL